MRAKKTAERWRREEVRKEINKKHVIWNNVINFEKYLTSAYIDKILKGKIEGERWRKIKKWWEEWTVNEWEGWRVIRGMVYAWVNVKRNEVYVGSTMETMMERCRGHLVVVKKVLGWKKEERGRRCKEEKIMPVHRKMTESMEDWVMLPLTGDVRDIRRVERRLVRIFGEKMNVCLMKEWRIKKEKKKRKRRPVMRVREKEMERKEEVKKRGAITFFRKGKERYEDLEKIVREGKGGMVRWERGRVDVTNWKRFEKEWRRMEVWIGKKKYERWNEVRKRIEKEERGSMKIKKVVKRKEWIEWVERAEEMVKEREWRGKEEEVWRM